MGTDLRRQSRLFRGVGRKASPARKPFQLVCGEANVKRSWAVASRSLPVVGLPGAHPSAFIPNGIAAERSSPDRADPHASRHGRARRRPNGVLIQGRARRGQSRLASAVPMLGAEPERVDLSWLPRKTVRGSAAGSQ
jgi:hypothetical protein